MRRAVCSVSSNVELPALPEARIEMRNAMRSLRPLGVLSPHQLRNG
jgi:hypothetical protein